MARTNNLNNYLTDIADAIREKKETTELINAGEFDNEIRSIETGIIPTETIDITENGSYDVINYANANVEVPTKTLTTKSITSNGLYKATDDGFDGYSEVNVETSGVDINDYFDTSKISNGGSNFFGWVYGVKNIPDTILLNEKLTSLTYAFYYLPNRIFPKIIGNTEKITSMNSAFRDAKCEIIDLSYINTSNVTDLNWAFAGCENLIKLDLSGWNTSKVKYMERIFGDLGKLAILDISNFDFSNVTSYRWMFRSCGTDCKKSDGAYADGKPFVYVKDKKAFDFVIARSNEDNRNWTKDNVIYPQSDLKELVIKGSNINIFNSGPYSIQLEILYNEFDDAYDDQRGVTWNVVSGNATVDENGLVNIESANDGDIFEIQATSIYNNSITSIYTITAYYKEKSVSIDLNDGEWIDSGTTVNGSIVYKSDKGSYHINNGKSTATITIDGYESFTFYIRSYAESSYDYTEAFELDKQAIRSAGLFKTVSKQSQTNYIECKYENIDSRKHTIQIMYSKDGGGDTGDDRGYFYIPEQ